MEKQCNYCGKHITKQGKLSITQWERKKFCSKECQWKGMDRSNFIPPLKGKKTAKPRKCSVCQEKNHKVFLSKEFNKLVCGKHFNQLKRYGKILWKKRKLITPLNRRIRHYKKSVQWRKTIFARDNFKCVLCGRKKCYLEADHYPITFSAIIKINKITSFKKAMQCEQLWDTDNGRTLCLKCHRGKNAYSINNRAYDKNRRISEKEREGGF